MSSDAIRAFGDRYGPYAFGIISLLIIWFAIVRPVIEANRVDTSQLKEIAARQAETAMLLNKTADRLDMIAARLEHINRGESK